LPFLFIVTLPPFEVVMTPVVVTCLLSPASFFSTFPQVLYLLNEKESLFALQGLQVAVQELQVAAAPVIDRTKRTSVKTPIALIIFFCIFNSSIVSTQPYSNDSSIRSESKDTGSDPLRYIQIPKVLDQILEDIGPESHYAENKSSI
jgi:hypothetical protein